MDRTLLERARVMAPHASLEKTFWVEAVSTAAYVKNRTPPPEKYRIVKELKSGWVALARVSDAKRRKLKQRNTVCWMIKQRRYTSIDLM